MGLLRLVLAICVFFAHAPSGGIPVLRGDTAVEIFYVISGFYMQLVLGKIYTPARLGQKWLQRFYVNRYLRLFPTYIIVAGATLAYAGAFSLLRPGAGVPLLSAITAVDELKQNWPNIFLKAYLLLTNFFMLFQDATLFLGVRDGTARFVADFSNSQIQLWQALAVPQAWSVGLELSFYLIAPFLLRLSSRNLMIISLAVLSVKIIFLAIVSGSTYAHTGIGYILPNATTLWGYRFFPFELSYFLGGALGYRYYESKLFQPPTPTRLAKNFSYVLIVVAATLASPLLNSAVICWLCPFVFAAAAAPLFSLFQASQRDRMMGNLSYPFYMLHILCIQISSPLYGLNTPVVPVVAALALTLYLSTVLANGEGLIEKLRSRLKSSGTLA